MTKKYIISDKELKDIIKKTVRYSKTILHPEDYISNFLKSKQPVKTLNEKNVRDICHKGIVEKTFETYGDTVNWLVSQILSLIPETQQRITHKEILDKAKEWIGSYTYEEMSITLLTDILEAQKEEIEQLKSRLTSEQGEVIAEGKAFVEKFMGFSNYKFGIGKLWHGASLSYELRKALQKYQGKQVKLILQIKE